MMSYVLAVMTQFKGGADEVVIKARGRSISRAVDVEQILRQKFIKLTKAKVELSVEEVTIDGGSSVVSAIEIRIRMGGS